jgi:hypothetical protein
LPGLAQANSGNYLIGVISKENQGAAVEEFFELFKTPWEFYRPGRTYDVVFASVDEVPEVDAKLLVVYGSTTNSVDGRIGIVAGGRQQGAILNCGNVYFPVYGDLLTFASSSLGTPCLTADSQVAGLRVEARKSAVIRLGYDLFGQVQVLLSTGQPVEHAHFPTLDIHIGMLRDWILTEGIGLLEIPPAPAGYGFAVCLTHDIDFVGIRNHKFDHTMWGFLYRSTVGAIQRLLQGRLSPARLFETWRAVASLPFVYLGWLRDFWEPFEWYLSVEKGLPATYFLIPFKGRAGEQVPGPHASWRAAAYDLDDLSQSTEMLKAAGCEIGVHGIDAWHSVTKAREEWVRITETTGQPAIGIRMHWLLHDSNTVSVLEQSGYSYDSTTGYNETVGYRAGTSQVFRPFGAKKLLELPLHIQDGALFYSQKLDLSEQEAEKRCRVLIENASDFGGVLTVIWHDRSHAPERFWGDFYVRMVQDLKSREPWFATASQAVGWFRQRRDVRFERLAGDTGVRVISDSGTKEQPQSLNLRVYWPSREREGKPSNQSAGFADFPWNGKNAIEFNSNLHRLSEPPVTLSAL